MNLFLAIGFSVKSIKILESWREEKGRDGEERRGEEKRGQERKGEGKIRVAIVIKLSFSFRNGSRL